MGKNKDSEASNRDMKMDRMQKEAGRQERHTHAHTQMGRHAGQPADRQTEAVSFAHT